MRVFVPGPEFDGDADDITWIITPEWSLSIVKGQYPRTTVYASFDDTWSDEYMKEEGFERIW